MKRSPMPRRKKPMTRSTALARKTPLARGDAELRRSTPMKQRSAKRKSESPQRLAVMERAGWRCEMEVSVTRQLRARSSTFDAFATDWYRCVETQGLQMAHVVRRRVAGHAKGDPDVCVAACVRCHDVADHRTHPSTWDSVRFPELAVARAVACIKKAEAARAAAGKAVVHLTAPEGTR